MKKIIRFLNKKWFNLLHLFWPTSVPAFPPHAVGIDASTRCNLKCPCCPTGLGEKDLSRGFLKFSDFKKFVDQYGIFLKEIFLSNKGEIFLNPEIFEIIKYAEDRKIKTYADTNLNYFDEQMAEKLVLSGMSELTVSIDGASQKSYSIYRVGGDFEKVISNIKSINKFKEKYHSKKPALLWQFIVFGHNQNEIEKAKKMSRELGMSFYLKRNFEKNFSPANKLEEIEKKFPVYNGEGSFCDQLWTFPRINYNGNMLGCCLLCDEKYHLGNVFKEGFFKVYNGERMKKARKIVLDKMGKDESILCSNCAFRQNPKVFLNLNNSKRKKDLIVTLADKNFINQAKQVFSSIYWNAGWKGDYMLLAHEIPEKDLKWFRDKGILVKNCKPLYNKPIGRDNYPPTVLDKFYLFTEEFKKWGHVIFLDGDVIVRGSLDKLSKTKLFSSPKILNHNFDSYFSFDSENIKDVSEFRKKHNLKRPTFNSGVMSFNTNLIKWDTFDNLVSLFKKYKNIINGDDAILNLFFYPCWVKSPICYNVRVNNSKSRDGIVLHFENNFQEKGKNDKPWEKENPFYNQWKFNLKKAESIDLNKTQLAKNFSNVQILYYFLSNSLYYFIKDKFFQISSYGDSLAGKMGIFLKKYSPHLYTKFKN